MLFLFTRRFYFITPIQSMQIHVPLARIRRTTTHKVVFKIGTKASYTNQLPGGNTERTKDAFSHTHGGKESRMHQSTAQTQPQSHANQHVSKEEPLMTNQRETNLTHGGARRGK